MLTDLEKLKQLLEQFGVGYTEERIEKYRDDGKPRTFIKCECGDKKVEGYGGFVTLFEFDADGEFLVMGAYE